MPQTLIMQEGAVYRMSLENKKNIQNIGRYFLAKCGELPKGRLVKLFYLLDWKSALESGKTVTDFTWYYNHFGPFLPEISDVLLRAGNDIILTVGNNLVGAPAEYIRLHSEKQESELGSELHPDTLKLINEIVAVTKDLSFTQFIKLVYSTFPVRTSQKYSQLDLVKLAKDYKKRNLEGSLLEFKEG